MKDIDLIFQVRMAEEELKTFGNFFKYLNILLGKKKFEIRKKKCKKAGFLHGMHNI